MEETSKKGWLSGVFKKAVYWGTIGLAITIAGNLFWQTLLDPLFFPVIHDVTNPVAQGLVHFMRDHFGFVLDWIGLTGDGGILQSEFVKSTLGLEEYYADAAISTAGDITEVVKESASMAIGDVGLDEGGLNALSELELK